MGDDCYSLRAKSRVIGQKRAPHLLICVVLSGSGRIGLAPNDGWAEFIFFGCVLLKHLGWNFRFSLQR